MAEQADDATPDRRHRRPRADRRAYRRSTTPAIALIVIGVFFLLLNIGAFSWFNWGDFWPVILIGLGAAILYGRYGRL